MPFPIPTVPELVIINFVTPDEEATKRSPLFTLLTLSAALLAIPPLIDNTAAILFIDPIRTPEVGVEVRTILPVPAAVKVRLPLLLVVWVKLPPFPTVSVPPLP